MPTLDPHAIRFSQRSIRGTFRDGTTIDELAQRLRDGSVKVDDLSPVRLVERGGNLFSLDNRRLEAFRRAGVAIPYRMASAEEIEHESWKFTTTNEGTSIRVR